VTVGRSGASAGVVCYIEEDFWPLNTCLYVRDFKGNHPRFAYYLLKTIDLASLNSGSAQPSLNRNFVHPVPAAFPEPSEQAAIASVLGALDDKIAMNQRINETLETTAQVIFKDWFVDFGPTRAKEKGQAPYLAPDIWSLFPSRLDDDGLPKGWSKKRVDDILELVYGRALRASERVDGPIPVYGSGGITGYHNQSIVEGPSIVVGRKGTVGSLYWEDRPFFPIDTVFFVKPKVPLTFCYYHLQTLGLSGMNTDAAVPGLNRNNVYRLPVPWGPHELRLRFDETVNPLRQLMKANSEESETLVDTRNLLLPRLMSGEFRVKDVEGVIGEAT
jgi:type I restriction enzyme S subunit